MMFSRCIQGFGNGMMFGYGSGPFSGNWFMPMVFMAVLAVLAISVVVLIIRKFTNLNKDNSNDAFLEELKTRFVKGEITEEEYMKKKNIINKLNS